MCVNVRRRRQARVTQAFLDRLQVYSLLAQEHRGSMAEIVETDPGQLVRLRETAPLHGRGVWGSKELRYSRYPES